MTISMETHVPFMGSYIYKLWIYDHMLYSWDSLIKFVSDSWLASIISHEFPNPKLKNKNKISQG